MFDAIITSMESRFVCLINILKISVSYDLNKLKYIPKEEILKNCLDLHTVLRLGESSDFEPYELYEELNIMKTNLPNNIKDVEQLLHYIIKK